MAGPLAAALKAVSPERIAARVSELARIGGLANGGVSRLGLTPEEQLARDRVASWLGPLGYDRRQDDACNLFCGSGPQPRVLMGSHLDSVPEGGRYDGALGVVAAVEVAEAAHATGLDLPLEIVGWTDEEGARFGIGLFGSGIAFARLPPQCWDRRDRQGISVREAATALLGRPPAGNAAALAQERFRAYLELHIEQGPHLVERDRPVGIVDHIVGLTHATVRVEGRADHAGTTPMNGRRDALAAAAECVLAVERIARESSWVVGTVGEIMVTPGAKNVVPGSCTFSLDIRSVHDEARAAAVRAVQGAVAEIAQRRGLRVAVDVFNQVPAAAMSPAVIAALERACTEVGLLASYLSSGAGHDAQNAAAAGLRTGMIFVRSTGGSHNPSEHAAPDDAAHGVRLLLATASVLAGDAHGGP